MIRSIGIDIGTKSIKIAEIHFSQGSRRLVDLVQINFDPAKGPWSFIKDFMTSRPKSGENVALGLGRVPVVLKKFSFPFSDRLKVQAAIWADFEDTLPVEISSYQMSYKLVSKAGKMHEYIAGICHNDDLDVLEKFFVESTFHPDHLGVDAEALGQLALHQNLPASLEAEPYIVIDIGYSSTKVAILKGHRGSEFFKDIKSSPETLTEIMEMRTLSRGSSEIVEWMADKKNLSIEDAQKWLMTRAEILGEVSGTPASAIGLETSDEIKTALRPVVVEIYQTLQAFRGQYDLMPKVAYITGGVTQLKGFREFVEHELRLKVDHWDIFKGFDTTQLNVSQAHRHEFALAVSLAHRFVISKARGWLNFRRTQALKKKIFTQSLDFLLRPDFRPVILSLSGFWIFMFAYMMASSYLLSSQVTEVRKALVSEFQKFDPDLGRKAQKAVLEVARTKDLFTQDVKRKLARISSGDTARAKVEFLLDLTEALPTKTRIKALQIESQGQVQKVVSSVELAEAYDDKQMKRLKESLDNEFKERGYSGLNFEKSSDKAFRLTAKWGGAQLGTVE